MPARLRSPNDASYRKYEYLPAAAGLRRGVTISLARPDVSASVNGGSSGTPYSQPPAYVTRARGILMLVSRVVEWPSYDPGVFSL
jgi:hypothetical protein